MGLEGSMIEDGRVGRVGPGWEKWTELGGGGGGGGEELEGAVV